MRFKRAKIRLSAVDPVARFSALYGDGLSARRVPASVEMRDDGLLVSPADAAPALWSYADLRAAEPIRDRSFDAVLSSRRAAGASLYVDDTLLLAQLLQRSPHMQLRFERWRTARPGLAVGAAALVAYASIWAFDLSPTKGVARTMPEKARAVLGDSVIRTMPAQRRCVGSEGQAALAKLMHRLMPNGPIAAGDITVLDWSMVNAFAVPGNRIVLTRALIEQARNSDELAAIIGHEAGHSLELHPEASLVRSVGFWALVQMVFTGTPGAIGNIGVVLAQLGYTRSAEREADGHALRLLREARIAAKPMGDFFRRMDQRAPASKSSGSTTATDILSSHPSNPERIARIDSQPPYPSTPALDDADWKSLKGICGNAAGAVPPVRPMPPPSAATPETAGKQPPPDASKAAAVAKAEAAVIAAKQETLRVEAAKAAAWKAEQLKQEAAKLEAAKLEIAKQEAAKQETAKLEAAKVEAARLEAARSDAAARDAAAKEVAAKDAAEKSAQVSALRSSEQAAGKQEVALATEIPSNPASAAPSQPRTIDSRIGDATKRLQLNPADTTALIERGQAYAAKPDFALAIDDFTRAIAIRPTDANTLFWRASMYAEQGKLDFAVTDYNDVIKLQPKNFAAFNNRGSVYRAQKKLDLALRDYSAAIAIDSKQSIALTNRALVYRERSNLDAAIADLNAAIAANPNYANAYARRGETLELKSSRDAAIADYRAVLRLAEPVSGSSEPHKAARARLTALGVKF